MPLKSWMVGATIVATTVLWFALLAHRPLFDPDEGRYAEIPREMLSGGDWVIPHLNALAYLEKPPLQYWLTALAFRVLGLNEFAARLCTGVAGFLSLLILYLLARKLWGAAAGMRTLLYAAASTLFVLLGHQLTLDMLLSFWLLAALACFLMAQVRRDAADPWRGWMLGCWASMALAVLTKGLIGVLIPGAAALWYMLWQRDWFMLKRLNLRWGVPLFVALAAPWFVMAARANERFLWFFFVREHFERYLTPVEQRVEPWWFFVPVLVLGVMPWLPQAARALLAPFTGRAAIDAHGAQRGFDAARLLWVWCVFVVVFFSLSDSKLITYVLPAVPALALLCAAQTNGDSRGNLLAGALLTLASSVAVLACAGGLWISIETRSLLLQARPLLFATGILLALGAALCVVGVSRGRRQMALAALCSAWFLGSGTVLLAADAAQSKFSARDLARALPGATPIFSVQSYQQSLPFYLRQPVVLVDYRDEFDLGLQQDPRRGIARLEEFAAVWRQLSHGFAVMPPRTREKLSAMGVPMRDIAQFPDRVLVSRQ